MNEVKRKTLPKPVIRRLPRYLTHVHELRHAGREWVSSQDIADALGLTSSTVRQDLSYLDMAGKSKRGYETQTLELVLQHELGVDSLHRTVIVGAGYMGSALALHGALAEHGFETCGVFDKDGRVVGTRVGELRVQPMTELKPVIKNKKVDIGIIAVPVHAAQEVAEQLVNAGVNGLLNLAYAHIRVPDHITLVDARILASLQELAYGIKAVTDSK